MNSSQEKNNLAATSEFQENLTLLREISFFSEFPLEMLKLFAYQCTRETYKRGEIIFSQSEDDGRAYYMLSGQTQLSRTDRNREIFVNTFTANTFFGAFILAAKVKRPFSLTALQDTSCLVLARENFQEVLGQFSGSRQYVIKGLVAIIQSWEMMFMQDFLACDACRKTMGVSVL